MAIERDPTIQQHVREQRQRDPELARQRMQEHLRFLERLGQAFLQSPGQEDADAGTPPPYVEVPDFQDTIVLCATHARGVWKLVGRWAHEKDVAVHTLMEHRDHEALRTVCRERGYQITDGRLIVEHHTGLEIWKRGDGGEGL